MPSTLTRAEAQAAKQAALDLVGGSFDAVMNALAQAVTGDGYIAGERFSAADVYVGAHIGWGLEFGSIERRPGFAEYWSRVSDREGFRRANALDEAAMPAPPA